MQTIIMCPHRVNKTKGMVIKCRIIIRTVRNTISETIRTTLKTIKLRIITSRTEKTSRRNFEYEERCFQVMLEKFGFT